MTATPTETPAQASTDAAETVEPTTGVADVTTTDNDTEDGKGNREAARYRRALREVEADRDTYRDRLGALRRQIIEEKSGLLRPAALWAAGLNPDDYFTEEGTLDKAALAPAIAEATDRLGLALAPRTPAPDPSQGARPTVLPERDQWADAFTPNYRRR